MPIRKVVIDPDLLTPKDFKRARVALGGRDPWEVLRGEQEDRAVLIAWCLLSRDAPDLTFGQLEDAPFGTFVEPDEAEVGPDPQTPGPTSNGSSPGNDTASKSKPRRAGSKTASAAATSSA